jgi:hypothetical protein
MPDSPLRIPADSGRGLGQVVVAVLEILRDLLERQAIRRVESAATQVFAGQGVSGTYGLLTAPVPVGAVGVTPTAPAQVAPSAPQVDTQE